MSVKPRSFPVPPEYLSLHNYLDKRYAETVVLTFAQIEDLLGFALPESAKRQPEWWTNAEGDATPTAQARSWMQAGRFATPNLPAHTVRFERAAG
jgi:hypothetical protein